MKKLQIITIGGMTGVGKTTLVKNLSKEIASRNKSVKVMYEMFENQNDNIQNDTSLNDEIFDALFKLFFKNLPNLEHEEEKVRQDALNRALMHQIGFLTNRATKMFSSIQLAKEQDLDYLIIDRTIFEDRTFS